MQRQAAKRKKRSNIACARCHSHKVKRSGQQPCTACQNSKNASSCQFPYRDKNIQVSESYINDLKAEVARLQAQLQHQSLLSRDHRPGEPPANHGQGEIDIPNPLSGVAIQEPTVATASCTALLGESSCSAFGERLLHCIDPNHKFQNPPTLSTHFQHPSLLRSAKPTLDLPNRIQASLLIRRALRFVGTDFHFLLRKNFFANLDNAYDPMHNTDTGWSCSLLVMLALGELYSNCHSDTGKHRVPGTGYFLQAVSLLQDRYDDSSIEHVQALILISFYANALGLVKASYTYIGTAMRMGITLGLHRSQGGNSELSLVNQENRRRTWWTLYVFDRLSCSKLGYPTMMNDEDMDVELPSMGRLSQQETEEFADPAQLCANIQLARISGQIINEIYCLPRLNNGTFIHRVHRILNSLRTWNEQLPTGLSRWSDGSPRNILSLHLHFNLCVIQTTRLILLHVFRNKAKFGKGAPIHDAPEFSLTTLALAESCVQAASTSNSILSRLFVEGSLAMYGYFDAHYLFSSTQILIMSAVMTPDRAMSDAVQTAFNLLRSMADMGNVAAMNYYQRLLRIRTAVESQRTGSANQSQLYTTDLATPRTVNNDHQRLNSTGIMVQHGTAMRDEFEMALHSDDYYQMDALDNPFIEQFLAENPSCQSNGAAVEDQTMQNLMAELSQEFMAGTY